MIGDNVFIVYFDYFEVRIFLYGIISSIMKKKKNVWFFFGLCWVLYVDIV